jgi:hypothetical protein
MHVTKNELQVMNLTVTEGLTVTLLPDSAHEFLMTTKEAAKGYGTSKYSIQKAFLRNGDELVEGKHYTTARTYCPRDTKLPHNAVLWTKRGIVRLGFYIKSERSKLFRDWAEDLVIQRTEHPTLFDLPPKQLPAHRKHNRLTSERLLSIMADVCQIEDKHLRISISNKLMMGGIQ